MDEAEASENHNLLTIFKNAFNSYQEIYQPLMKNKPGDLLLSTILDECGI